MRNDERLTNKRRTEVITRDRNQCVKCGREHNLHVHHIISRLDGGSNDLNNLITNCSTCHREWEIVEDSMKNISYEEWLLLPNLSMMIVVLYKLPDLDDLTLSQVRVIIENTLKERKN